MNPQDFHRILSQSDSDDVSDFMSQVDPEVVSRLVGPYLEDEIGPHLEEIKQRAQTEDVEQVRESLKNMPEQEVDELLDKSITDVIVTLRLCREKPKEGFGRLKTRLRDPYVYEPILHILDNEEDREVARLMMKWAGASVLPEMYTIAEKEELQRTLRSR